MSVLTHGHREVLRHFQGSRHFARDQSLCLETPGWRVLAFHGNPLGEDYLERQREKIRKGPLVVHDREHPFADDLITDEAGVVDPQLPVLAKVSCLVDALRMEGSHKLIEKLWAQFVLTAGSAYTEVVWTRDEVLVSSVNFRNHFVTFLIHIVVLLLDHHRYWNAAPNSVASGWLGEGSPIYSFEFEERGESLWAFVRTWNKDTFHRVAVAVTDRFAVEATQELSVLGSVVAAVGGSASLVAVSGGSLVLTDTYGEYL